MLPKNEFDDPLVVAFPAENPKNAFDEPVVELPVPQPTKRFATPVCLIIGRVPRLY